MRIVIKGKKRFGAPLAGTFNVWLLVLGVVGTLAIGGGSAAYAIKVPAPGGSGSNTSGSSTLKVDGPYKGKYQCGSGANAVYTTIDIGCKGNNCKTTQPGGCSALTDAVFAIIRFLSIGVGLVVVASMIWAGIQYATSRDDPAAVGKAKERILNNIIALLVYIFSYAILNYLIPKGFFG